MNGLLINLEARTVSNNYFREVLYTDEYLQLVIMSLKPMEEIGMEIHEVDQFIKIEVGEANVIIDDKEHAVKEGYGIIIPAGVQHNVINVSQGSLKLYSVYCPPEHQPGTTHETKEEADAEESLEK